MYLFINTALLTHQIAIVQNGEILFLNEFSGGRDGEIPFYKTLLDIKQKYPNLAKDIDSIVVLTGPGSFTSLRLGISCANSLAFISGKKVYGIPTVDWIKLNADDYPVILPAGGHFVHLFKNDKHEIVDMDDLNKELTYNGEVNQETVNSIKVLENLAFEEKIKFLDLSKYQPKDQVFPEYMKEVL